MNLKIAFQYQNKLSDYINTITSLIEPGFRNDNLIIKKTIETHKKSAVIKDACDEVIDRTINEPPAYDANMLIFMLEDLLQEKENTAIAIKKAKDTVDYDLDILTSLNKTRMTINSYIKKLCLIKPLQKTVRKEDYTFNQEGNQTVYYYNCDIKEELLFDQEKIFELRKRLDLKFAENSELIDEIYIGTKVDVKNKYDIIDTFDDAYEKFVSSIK